MKHKKITIGVIIILMICIACGTIGYFKYENTKKYKENFNKAEINIEVEESTAAVMANKESEVWDDAIQNSDDFETAVNDLHEKYQQNGSLKSLINDSKKSEEIMKLLKNPPKNYGQAYSILVKMYTKAESVKDMARYPSGSLNSYTNNLTNTTKDFDDLHNNLKVIIPSK